MARVICNVLLVMLIVLLNGCAIYSANPISARVVDADTKEPLEGVNVVAHWNVVHHDWNSFRGDMVVMEDVTDKEGRFHFPAWGPKRIPKEFPWGSYMEATNPHITLYKPGYAYQELFNDRFGPQEDFKPGINSSDWNGKTVEMKKFEGTVRDYSTQLHLLLTDISFWHCLWTQMPNVLATVYQEEQKLKALGKFEVYSPSSSVIKEIDDHWTKGCRPVQDVVKGYVKDKKVY